jgi:hypothetical protein
MAICNPAHVLQTLPAATQVRRGKRIILELKGI